MLFAITIEKINRDGFENDRDAINACLNILMKNYKCEMGDDIGWELQPKGMHNMHIHTYVANDKKLPYVELYKKCLENNCKLWIKTIDSAEDFKIWKKYCKKEKYDLAYEYAESTRPNNRDDLFREHRYKTKDACYGLVEPA